MWRKARCHRAWRQTRERERERESKNRENALNFHASRSENAENSRENSQNALNSRRNHSENSQFAENSQNSPNSNPNQIRAQAVQIPENSHFSQNSKIAKNSHENSQNALNFSHAQAPEIAENPKNSQFAENSKENSQTTKTPKNSQENSQNSLNSRQNYSENSLENSQILANQNFKENPREISQENPLQTPILSAPFAFNKNPKTQKSLAFSPKISRLNEPLCFALKAKDENLVLNSSSGGAFSLIAEFVLERGGVVFGAAFDENLKVRHICVQNPADLGRLRRSKYVESFIGDSFAQAQSHLKRGALVLFSGTQCQIHALNAFLRKPYENLITIEVICNSVPSAGVWEIYKESLESEMGEKLTDFNFRGKNFGWENYALVAKTAAKRDFVVRGGDSPYIFNAWATHIITRKSCGNCYSKGFVSGADFTLGDFWGIRAWHSDFIDDKGVSCVLAHSQKSCEILQTLSPKCEMQRTNLAVIALGNPTLLQSNGIHPQREAILREFFATYESTKSAKSAVQILEKFTQNQPQMPTKTGFFRHYYLVYKNDPIRRAISNALKRTRKWLVAGLGAGFKRADLNQKIHANSTKTKDKK